MKLKLTDKIRKFFGNQGEQGEGEDLDGDAAPVFGGSLEASLANMAAIKPPAAARHSSHSHHMMMPQQLHSRTYCPGFDQQGGAGGGGGAAAAAEKHSMAVQLQHLAQHSHQLPSCTNSQKDAKELTSGLRTTGQDESYSLQNEVYFPQLLLTLQGGTPEQKAVAAEALFNYTAESDAARQRATQAGVVAHLVDLLRAGTEHGKMYAAYTLSSLTTIDESLEQMHTHGAIPALIDILSSCPLLVCKKGAMRALGRLARSDEAAQAIVGAGGLGPIISLLSRPDSSLVRRCLIALYFIGADKDALQQAIGAAGALPQLLLLARSESPDVQAEATDVLKVLCRNASCGRMLAELGGIEVLVTTAHSGLTSRAKAAATRALQRLHDIPELSEALSASTARDLQLDMSPSHSSQLNSSSGAPAAAAALAAAAATAAAVAAAATAAAAPSAHSPLPPAAALSPAQQAPAAAAAAASPGFVAVGSQPEDIQQLAQVLASGNSRWLREKAAAAVEQLAADNPVACRDLASLGALPALLDMLDAGNSSSTRRAAARALGQLSDDAVMLVHMADSVFVSSLVVAAPQLSGSAQRGVIRVLHSLASVPNAVASCFPKQQTVCSMMQILDSPNAAGQHQQQQQLAGDAAGASAQQQSTMSGGSNGGSGAAGPDAGVCARAIEVLLAVCRAEEAALAAVKEYPSGFKLLVSQLQHGPRSSCSLILQLLSILAQHKQHQEDLLKCGVVPTLLLLYRSDDSTVALQAARIMESLSEPASSILQRSLSAGGRAMDASSSDGSSIDGSSNDGSGNGMHAAASGVQPSPLGAEARRQPQQQQPVVKAAGGEQQPAPAECSSSSDSSADQSGAASSASYGSSSAAGSGAGVDGGTAAASAAGNAAVKQAGSNSSNASASAASSQQQQEQAAAEAGAAPNRASAGDDKSAAAHASSDISPARRVAAVAAAMEGAVGTGGSLTPPAASSPSASPSPPPPAAGAAAAQASGQRSRQSSIPAVSRPNVVGSKTPAGLGQAPLVTNNRRPTPSRAEQPNDAAQLSQQQQQQQTVQQQSQQQPNPEDSSSHAGQRQQQQQAQQPQQRGQSQMPSRLPRRSAQAQLSSPGTAASTSSSPIEPGSRTGTPDPANKRKPQQPQPQQQPQHVAASSPAAAAAAAPGRCPSASAVHLRVLAAQKQSQKSLSGSGGAPDNSGSSQGEASSAPGSPLAAGSSSSSPQQQQKQHEVSGTGRVMQMAAAIVANAEAAARSASPQRPAKQPSQQQVQVVQQQQPQQQQHQEPSAAPAVAEQAAQVGNSSGAEGTSGKEAVAAVPASGGGRQAAAAGSSAGSSSAAKQPAAVAAPAPSPPPAAAAAQPKPPKEKPLGVTNLGAAPGPPAAADADDLLSSTYDNLHGLLLKKGDIEICRTAEGRKCRLGEGGFGIVYKAVMNGVDEVAVKLVKAETPSRKELELFLKEVQTLAKLHHRNIVQFYGACLEMGSMFFVTELMKGGDLYSALRHHSETMKWERLGRKVALDVALGLNYLHAQRPPMMHRDLKSPNVLLSEEGVAKIADVGMVRSQVKDLVTAQPVMTPLWAAPEVVRHERASIKADIWSYGILIWELITGEDITEYQPLSISRQVGPSPNAKAMALPARCPAVARKLFVACTQMDPERRPGAQQLVEWLRADIAASRG